MTVPKPALLQALDCLERYSSHPDTPALHDPIYALLQADEVEQEKRLGHALVSLPAHPGAAELRAILGHHISLEPASLVTVLDRHGGGPVDGDLIAEVDRRLQHQAQHIRGLKNQIDGLERDLVRADRASNGVAALGAFSLIFGIFGWLIALGFVEVQWMDPPVPSSPGAASIGAGSPSPGELGRKP